MYVHLMLQIPAVPRKMLEKALWYIDHQDTHIWITKKSAGNYFYYFLRQQHQLAIKKIGKMAVMNFIEACNGNKK